MLVDRDFFQAQTPVLELNLVKVLGLRGEHPTSAVDWSAGDCGPAVTAGTDGAVKIYTLLCQ